MAVQILEVPRRPRSAPRASKARSAPASTLLAEKRRIGVEFEFAELSPERAARIAARALGGAIKSDTQTSRVDTPLGEFAFHRDAKALDRIAKDPKRARRVQDWIGDVSAMIAPVRAVCPPLERSQLPKIDSLIRRFRKEGALGTHCSLYYAFGAHLNIEMVPADPPTILRFLRAYVLLSDWLRAEIDVNPLRMAAGFDAGFPAPYRERVLDPSYAPDQTALIDDYLAGNASPFRGLNLLPILAHLSAKRVDAGLSGSAPRARPAIQYRLPNCEIDAPSWSIALELTRWDAVERLAANPALLFEATIERSGLLAEAPQDAFTTCELSAAQSVALSQKLGV